MHRAIPVIPIGWSELWSGVLVALGLERLYWVGLVTQMF